MAQKIKESEFATTVLEIRPSIMFRATTALASHKRSKPGLLLKNLSENCFYEFSGQAAWVWLCIDGLRTVDKIIRDCRRIAFIKDPRFEARAQKFLGELVEAGLILKVFGKPQRDKRADDMKEYLSFLLSGGPRAARSPHLSPRRHAPSKKIEPGDRATINEVKKKFAGLVKGKNRLTIKRKAALDFGGRFHVFSSEVSLFGIKSPVAGYGAGLSVEKAVLSAAGEAIERLFTHQTEPDVVGKSFAELVKKKQRVLNPATFKFFSPNQDSLCRKEVINVSRNDEIDWTLFEDAFYPGKKIFVPGDVNGTFLRKSNFGLFGEVTSSGCALGVEPTHAKLNGTLELIERDHLLLYWRTRNTPPLIDLSKPNDRLGNLIELLGEKKKRVRLFYLRSELDSVTVQAVLLGDPARGEPLFLSSCASRLSVTDAIEKAVIELLFILSGFNVKDRTRICYGRYFDNSLWEFGDSANLYAYKPEKEAYGFLISKNPKKISWADIQGIEKENAKEGLASLISSFRKNHLRLYFRNNSPPALNKAGFWVYRAFSPDLIPIESIYRFRRLGLSRYYKLPAQLGLERQPRLATQLNPWPHPLP